MKILLAICFATLIGMFAGYTAASPRVTHSKSEWVETVKTPPCPSIQNIEVIFPAQPNGAVTIECNVLP